jgi:hypothetical protein
MKNIKIIIKRINNENVQEVEKFVKEKKLKPFHSLSFQFKNMEEGIYEIDLSDTKNIFDDQYNASKDGKDYRIFEYSRCWNQEATKTLNTGYYIAEGIEEIRAIQKRISRCNYCGKHYIDSKQEFCDSNNCLASEYLEENNYPLLRLTNINDKHSNEPLPEEFINKIKKVQREANLDRLRKEYIDRLDGLNEDINNAKLNYELEKLLVENDFSYSEIDNLIYYSNQEEKEFCFGWRESIKDKKGLRKRLDEIPGINKYNIRIK